MQEGEGTLCPIEECVPERFVGCFCRNCRQSPCKNGEKTWCLWGGCCELSIGGREEALSQKEVQHCSWINKRGTFKPRK